MTFTDAGCSCADTMPGELVAALKTIDGIEDAQVEIVWSPAWKMTRISRLGRITLGISLNKGVAVLFYCGSFLNVSSYCLSNSSIVS